MLAAQCHKKGGQAIEFFVSGRPDEKQLKRGKSRTSAELGWVATRTFFAALMVLAHTVSVRFVHRKSCFFAPDFLVTH
jgi:hypothetical protein